MACTRNLGGGRKRKSTRIRTREEAVTTTILIKNDRPVPPSVWCSVVWCGVEQIKLVRGGGRELRLSLACVSDAAGAYVSFVSEGPLWYFRCRFVLACSGHGGACPLELTQRWSYQEVPYGPTDLRAMSKLSDFRVGVN